MKKMLIALLLVFAVAFTPLFAQPAKEVQTVETTTATRTIVDMAGREVTIPTDIEKIGTLGSVGVLNAFVELMGDGSKIYNAMPGRFATGANWKMQYEFAPQIASGPLFESGNEILIENILEADPDVCFTMTKDTAKYLEEHGVACVYLEWKDTEDVKKAVKLMGEILNKEDMAEKYITYFDDTVAYASSLTSSLKDEDKVTVLYGDPISFSQPHVIAEWWITAAGGISVTNDGRTSNSLTYTMEDLLEWNPEMIIVTSGKLIDEIKANSNYSEIEAVKNNNFHVIPSVAHVWGNRTVEQPLTVLWTLHHLYPELLSREELKSRIHDFYSTFFLYDMSDEQISAIIDK